MNLLRRNPSIPRALDRTNGRLDAGNVGSHLRRSLRVLAAFAAIVLLIGVAVGCGSKKSPAGASGAGSGTSGAAAHAARKWQCPMHPEIIRDAPGDCPICGMKLVPIESEAPAVGPAGAKGASDLVPVKVDAAKRQLLGLTTADVKRGPFATTIRTVGRVAYDERLVHHVHTRYDAYVEHIMADFTGKYVKKGEILAEVYSPDLYATQQEYLLALKASRTLGSSGVASVAQGGRELLAAARERLLLWDVSPADIDALEKRGTASRTVNLYAPISGFITSRTAYHGMKVSAADTLFDIADLSRVWVFADVYENELPRIALGEAATITLSYWPARSWSGTVSYVYPAVDEKTRTVKVRIELPNPHGDLKPEMFADVTIRGRLRTVLEVPDDAVLDSGTRHVVFVSGKDETLVPREITVGDRGGGVVEVLAGLSEGDVVVRRANFLVDSESRLKAAIAAMAGPK